MIIDGLKNEDPSFVKSEAEPEATCNARLFWDKVEKKFAHLGVVFLQISEVFESVALNGELHIQTPITFSVPQHVAIAALNGLTIEAKSIKSRGMLLSKKNIVLKVKHEIDNQRGILSASATLLCHARSIKNNHGSIECGAMEWFTGHRATLSNDHGTILGRAGIKRRNKHVKSADADTLNTLSNKHGRILVPDGPLDIFLDHVDNTEGLLQGAALNIRFSNWSNKQGKLLLLGNAELEATFGFNNDFGLVDCTGHLSLRGQAWQNKNGILQANLGIDVACHRFSSGQKGIIIARGGHLRIEGVSKLKLAGQIGSAKEMHLVAGNGPVKVQGALLQAPQQLITITSKCHLVDLEGSLLTAASAHIEGFEQIDCKSTTFDLENLSLKSIQGWISAQTAIFHVSQRASLLACKAVYFKGNRGSFGSLDVESMTVYLEDGQFQVQSDLQIKTDRFSARSNALDIGGKAFIQATRSLRSCENQFNMQGSALLQLGEDLVICQGDTVDANEILRNGRTVLLEANKDTGQNISNTADERLLLFNYKATVGKEFKLDSHLSLFNNNQWKSQNVDIKADQLWMDVITCLFEKRMGLLVASQGNINQLTAKGETLACTAKELLSMRRSAFEAKSVEIEAETISLSQNSLRGSTRVHSTRAQHLAGNSLWQGDVELSSEDGNLIAIDNKMDQVGNLLMEAPNGVLQLHEMDLNAATVQAQATDITIERGKIRAKKGARLKSKRSLRASTVKVEAQHALLEAGNILDVQKAELSTLSGTHIFSDGLALIQKCQLLGLASIESKNCHLWQSTLSAGLSSIQCDIKDINLIQESSLGAQSIDLKQGQGQLMQAQVNSTNLSLMGSNYIEESHLEASGGMTVAGDLKQLIVDSELNARNGSLNIDSKEVWARNSTFQAPQALWQGDLLNGFGNHLTGLHFEGKGAILNLMQSSIHSRATVINSRERASLFGSDVSGVFNCTSLGVVDLSCGAFKGDMHIKAKGSIQAHKTAISSRNVQIETDSSLNGHGLSLNGVEALSMEVGQAALLEESVFKNCQALSITADQLFGAGIDMHADFAALKANKAIHMPGSRGKVDCLLVEAPLFDVCGAKLEFQGQNWMSKYSGGALISDKGTSFSGQGGFEIDCSSNYLGAGAVDLAQFSVTAPSVRFDGKIKAREMHAAARSESVFFHGPLQADVGVFSANKQIVNENHLHFNQEGSFTSYRLQNGGSIASPGLIQVHQTIYNNVKQIDAGKQLTLTSKSSICQEDAITTSGNLALESFDGRVISLAPLDVGKDLFLKGTDVQLYAHGAVGGSMGVTTPGSLQFNRTSYHVKNGIDAVVGDTFACNTSSLTIQGQSTIRTKDFILRSNHAEGPCHVGSNFNHQGPLYLEIGNQGINDASNFMVDGDLFLKAGEWKNQNSTHLHTYQVEVGRRKKKFCGVKYGSTAIIEERTDIIIDGVANTQVSGNARVEISKMSNDGVFHAGGNATGMIASLQNGIFTSIGRAPTVYSSAIPSFGSHVYSPGGDIRVDGDMHLSVPLEFKNRGFIRAGGALSIAAPEVFLNERRVTEEKSTITKKNLFASTSAAKELRDHVDVGGVISAGGVLQFSMGRGVNRGGQITCVDDGSLSAQEFTNEALSARRVVALNPGHIAPWQSAKEYSLATDFVPASITSGGTWTQTVENCFRNLGSSVVGFAGLTVVAGSIEQCTLFSSHKAIERRNWKSSKDIYEIQMQEAAIYSVSGSTLVTATKGDISLEGKCGSMAFDTEMHAKGSIYLKAHTVYVDNNVSTLKFTPTTITSTDTDYNSYRSSLPDLFAGRNMSLTSGGKIHSEGAEFCVGQNFTVKAQSVSFLDHLVNHYISMSGSSVGMSFFGSDAIESAWRGENGIKIGQAILSEDPAIASAFALAKMNVGPALAFQAFKTAVHTWNEATMFSKAYNQGELKKCLGEHLGITHGGKFNPSVTVRFGSFDEESNWQSISPTRFSVGGCMEVEAQDQLYRGVEASVCEGATFIGEKIDFEAPTLNHSRSGSSSGLSFTVEGSGAAALSLDMSKQWSKGSYYNSPALDFGKYLRIQQAKQLNIKGAILVADDIDVAAESTKIQSLVDFTTGGHFSASVSTSGQIGGSFSKNSSATLQELAGLYARRKGVLHGQKLVMEGGALQAVEAKVREVQSTDIALWDKSTGGGFNLNVRKLVGKEGKGLMWLGDVHMESCRQKGLARSGGQVEMHKKKGYYVAAPLLAINRAKLQGEAQEIQRAWNKLLSTPKHAPKVLPAPHLPSREFIRFLTKPAVKPIHLTPDGSIEPVSDAIMSLMTLHKISCKKEAANVSRAATEKNMCSGSKTSKCPTALVLTANADHNGAFDLTLFSVGSVQKQTLIFKRLEREFDTRYVRISNAKEMCHAIDTLKAQGIAIDLLILRAHGSQQSMDLDKHVGLSVRDTLPQDSCLKNLSPQARIVLNSCSTGRGKNGADNLANFIARHAPAEAKVYAPVENSVLFDFSKDALDFEFVCLPRGSPQTIFSLTKENMTYKIDNAKKTLSDHLLDEMRTEQRFFHFDDDFDLRSQARPAAEKIDLQAGSSLFKMQGQISASSPAAPAQNGAVEEKSDDHALENFIEHVVGAFVLKRLVGKKTPIVHQHHTAPPAQDKDKSKGKSSFFKEASSHKVYEVLTPEKLEGRANFHFQPDHTPDLSKWSAYSESSEYFLKDNELEKIAVVRGLVGLSDAASFAVSAAAYPFMEGFKHAGVMANDLCQSHPKLNKQCLQVATAYANTKESLIYASLQAKDFAISTSRSAANLVCNAHPEVNKRCQKLSVMWNARADTMAAWKLERSTAIEKIAVENESKYGIPQDMTLQHYADGEELVATAAITAAIGLAGKLAGPLFKQKNKPKPAKGLQGEILLPNDTRDFEAKDVTPQPFMPAGLLEKPKALHGEILLPGDIRGLRAKNVTPK